MLYIREITVRNDWFKPFAFFSGLVTIAFINFHFPVHHCVVFLYVTGDRDGIILEIMSIVIISSSRTILRYENLSLIIHHFRFCHFKNLLFVFYVPIYIITISFKFQGQFVVAVSCSVVVFFHILSQHETIFYDSDSRFSRILRTVNRINLDV